MLVRQGRRTQGVGTPGGGSGGVQSAVALTPVDGESITDGVQSNFAGNGWWERNGFTRAANWTATNPLGGTFNGFDDPNFIPIGLWLGVQEGSMASRLTDLGVNGHWIISGPQSNALSLSGSNSWAIVTWEEPWTTNVWPPGTIPDSIDPYVIGVATGEEPSSALEYENIVNKAVEWLANATDGPGRIHILNHFHSLLNGDIQATYDGQDMVLGRTTTRTDPEPQITTLDHYFFGGAPLAGGQTATAAIPKLYQGSASPDAAHSARGSHYGSVMDCMRKFYPSGQPKGFSLTWVENGAPFTEADSAAITPAQLKWAVWSTLVHGARGIAWFNHTFRTGDPGSNNNFGSDLYGGPGVAGTGIYAAAKETNRRALALAPVINAPFDGYFVWGDGTVGGETVFGGFTTTGAVSIAGFLTAVTSTNARSVYGGVEACCKWQPDEEVHYILSTTREAEAATNIPATFRMVDQGQTSAVEVHAGTTLSIARGGSIPGGFCEFSDTFATGATYKTYRID